jgi:hypothetical protein
LGLTALGKGANVLYDKITRNHRLEKVKEFSPDLKKADPKLLNQGMKTLERLNPQISKDPLAAGGFLKQIVKNKGVKIPDVREIVETANREDQASPFITASKALGKDL